MPKLVVLNAGMTGRVFEINTDRTTVGRVDSNAFQIEDASVSSRHAEILLKGADLLIRDLNSTNGTFINGQKISESVLKPGQTLRFGEVELKIDNGQPVNAPAGAASASASAASSTALKKTTDGTIVIPRGVSLNDLEQSGARPGALNPSSAFSKKSNHINKYFLIGAIAVGVIIVGLIVYLIGLAGNSR